jgi:hypothetical protein
MSRSTLRDRSLAHGLRVVWLLFATLWLLPIYFEGTRSILVKVFSLSPAAAKADWVALVAAAILLPLAYGWKAGRRTGLIVQSTILVLLVFWSLAFDPEVLTSWSGYAGKLAVVCAITAGVVSLLLWGIAAAKGRSNAA